MWNGRGSAPFAKHERTLYMVESLWIPPPSHLLSKYWLKRGKQTAFDSLVSDTLSFWIIDSVWWGIVLDTGCIFRSFPHIFRGRTCRTNLNLPTPSGSKRFPGRSQQWEELLSETPDLREGSHSGCGANSILVWWLSCHRASGSRIEHVYLRGKKNKKTKKHWNIVTFADLKRFWLKK